MLTRRKPEWDFEVMCAIPEECPEHLLADSLAHICFMKNPMLYGQVKYLHMAFHDVNYVIKFHKKWRAFFKFDHDSRMLTIVHISHRNDAYKKRRN